MDGQMLTAAEIAGKLGVKAKAIYNWRYFHRGSDGAQPSMAEAVAHFRRIKAGLKPLRGGSSRRAEAYVCEADRDVVRAVNTILEILGY